MTEKTFNNARIIHKGDTEANWKKATGFIPKAKEIIVYLPDENYSYSRMKIGDGVNGINDLPFFGGNIEGLATEEWVVEQADLLAEELQGYVDNSVQGLATEEYVNEAISAIPLAPQSDWKQSDETQLDYIKNRPFYEKIETLPRKEYRRNGLDGYLKVEFNDPQWSGKKFWIKISDDIISEERLKKSEGICYTINPPEYLVSITEDMIYKHDGYIIIATSSGKEYGGFYKLLIIQDYNKASEDLQISFSENGLYVLYSESAQHFYGLVLNEMDIVTEIKQLDDKFIPDSIARTEYVDEAVAAISSTTQSDWNQNDETEKDYIKNRPFYTITEWKEIVNDNYTTENIDGVYGVQREFSEVLSDIPSTINLILDGMEYGVLTVKYNSLINAYYVGNIGIMNNMNPDFAFENTGESFLIGLFLEGFLLITDPTQSTTHSLIVSIGKQSVVKLDNKYLSIDQVYDANSENAQSGIAVNEAINNFMDRYLTSSAMTFIVETNPSTSNGMEVSLNIATEDIANIIISWGDGTINNELSHKYSKEGKNIFNCKVYGITKINSFNSVDGFFIKGSFLIKEIIIPNSVTSIGAHVFSDCSSLTSITIPDSVTSIGSAAFARCTNLTSMVIPYSVTTIESSVFSDCTSLTSVIIPYNVTSIGESAFSGCDSLTSVVIGDSVTSIGDSAFYSCDSLTSIVIPDSVTSIGAAAFSWCSNLRSVVIGNSVTSIGNQAFYECSSLTSIELPDSVASIGYEAFRGCDGLTSVVIPDSVTSIGEYAFYGCDSLTSAIFTNPIPINYTASISWFGYGTPLTHIYVPYGTSQDYKEKWAADGAEQAILDLIVESDREALEVLEDKVVVLDERTKDCPRTEKDWVEIVNGNYTTDNAGALYQAICNFPEGVELSEKPSVVKILLDGIEYNNLIPIDSQHNSSWIVGNASIFNPIYGTSYEKTDEHFAVMLFNNQCILNVGASYSTAHNFALLILGDKVIKLDEKYLPDTIVLKDELPVVDQVYNAESANAQSGVAVAEAIKPLEDKNNEQSEKMVTIEEKIVTIEEKIVAATKDNILSIF